MAIPQFESIIKAFTSVENYRGSTGYMYVDHRAEGLVFEIGDNTLRDILKTKGEVGAVELMKLLLENE